ncbi:MULTISPECIES: hypothetical protein [Streptomyces]|uniref:hypothetical protein n=1 Tax=Streptomyces TaxID=1883 RepID=UPI00224947CC|nr:hypothetical protein [Streptomyces sp. JHD 1]MCX2970108.1 hypothetical protein [Streptomyces sp. JHD 1]
MSRYRVQYGNEALTALSAMTAARRSGYEAGMTRLASAPYGHGSTPAGRDRDRRQAAVAGTITLYRVSHSAMTVSVVRIVH